jgi:hypothetical protein
MNLARTMLHFYDFQDALDLGNVMEKMKFEGKQIQGTTYKFEFDKHYLRAHARFYYSHSVIISLVTALETYFEAKLQSIQCKIPKDNQIQSLIDDYLKEKRFQQIDTVTKLFNRFQIDIFKDVDRNTITELFNRRHIIIHSGGLIKDQKTRIQFNAKNTPVGEYATVRGETLEKYIDTIVKMVSSIEQQSMKYESLPIKQGTSNITGLSSNVVSNPNSP